MASIASALGQTIRRHRLAAQLTHEKLAERASLHPNHISVLERGKQLPTVAALIRIGDALGVPALELLKEAQQDAGRSETGNTSGVCD